MSFDVLWLSRADMDTLGLTMREIMDVVEEGFAAMGRGEVEMPAKIGIHTRKDCFNHSMPCYVGGTLDMAGVKVVSGYPPNQKKGLPYITGIWTLIDPETGLVRSVMDAAWITAWRTGAASGVYARHFGDPETKCVGIVGLGVQGHMNLRAMIEVFPKIEEVRMFDPFAGQAERFTADMQPLLPNARFINCADPKACVTGADVVITCTPIVEKPERFIKSEWLKEDVLAIAVDYDSAFDAETMSGAVTFTTDSETQYLWTQDHGTYFQNGYPSKAGLHSDMGEICAGKKPGARKGRRSAVLMGIALDDVMTGHLLYEKALEMKTGTWVQL
ncbi:MAG TPA: ornithine cyclodeaminase family protein [Humidesulfovibrio sp.]|uniref:ornithine cyclodeaminase family protein n=1 Tax=Humidesulfovibrio sp. TaxID=2910988 RepID=UPI002CD99F6E|nr:ornithine cyclodeaminase family protein [Humidesulfovibrio sp.]HWR04314.1 ornithine cyclodeaminase family protein [Humidesulfovibrio sp.]